MQLELSRLLRFPGYCGQNLAALNDCLTDVIDREYGFPDGATGLVLALTGFDEFAAEFPEQAHGLLDVFADSSHRALVAGKHLICLVQTGDPQFRLPPVGCTPLTWNEAEWLNAARGL